ncbi:hypothetical protein GCM10010145_41680 [Streptomyces ruber]|uniref:Uncharacterized protein n=2 Tax=Streptomyces TaxID=1883 RepID=A0A918ET17_9ACTN|nr:hypothetical protein GCM10010145_41680 [Streptomyces ruber]
MVTRAGWATAPPGHGAHGHTIAVGVRRRFGEVAPTPDLTRWAGPLPGGGPAGSAPTPGRGPPGRYPRRNAGLRGRGKHSGPRPAPGPAIVVPAAGSVAPQR